MVNADRKFKADVYCEDGIIRLPAALSEVTHAVLSLFLCRKVGSDLKDVPNDARVVDATGKLVMPGELLLRVCDSKILPSLFSRWHRYPHSHAVAIFWNHCC